jgi:general secretion pathway protein G
MKKTTLVRRVSLKPQGFTLLEMLVVLVIIGLLAGLVGPRLFANVDKAKVQTAGAQIKNLSGAIESMRLDISAYPSAEQGMRMLNVAPDEPTLKVKWKGPYLSEGVPADPWGNPYQYQVPGPNGLPFLVLSFGADGKAGGEGNDADIGIPKQDGPAK